jgi:WD40 repeat protein/serine/threonine protein kinase
VGRRLGEFALGEKISEGGFGAIYRAEQVGLKRQAVVKILRSRFADDETTQLRFLREARLASSLDHPYAAHIYAFGAEPDGLLWIAMELVRGTPLNEMLRAGPMPLKTFVPLLERLCEVVETAHELGIVHRDIKPQNVMVISRAGALLPKLLDLGIAKDAASTATGVGSDSAASWDDQALSTIKRVRKAMPVKLPSPSDASEGNTVAARPGRGPDEKLEETQSSLTPSFQSLTGEGDLMGSPSYMAPEQWVHAELVTKQCDIYSLGVLAYEAIVGRRPFTGALDELARAHLRFPVPELPSGFPDDLHAVLARAMAKEPAARQVSAVELGREFRQASGIGADAVELPKLARDIADVALRDYPQPLAEAVADVDGARGVYHALDAATRLTRVAVRLLAIIALAAWKARRSEEPLSNVAGELLSSLRKRRLSEEEWFDLGRAFTRPFASRPEDHLVPEVVALFAEESRDGKALAELIQRHTDRTTGTLPPERMAVGDLSSVLEMTAGVLRSLAFLADYPLAVVGPDGALEMWTGVRRKNRATRPFPHDVHLEAGDPVLLGDDDHALPLAPIAIVRKPSPNADREFFLLEGRGRHGILLTALPGGFEQTSEAALDWLNLTSSVDDSEPSVHLKLDVPYRGLAPLTAADSEVFFGREREVEAFVNRLRTEPLLVVAGPSGAGKSSFARAGVVPALGESFHAVVFRPGSKPLATLRAKLAHAGVRTDDLSTAAHAEELASRVRTAARGRDETIVVLVDQFEETFTMTRDTAERTVFCAWLVAMAASATDPVRVVLTLRDDFLTKAQQESGLRHRLAPALELLSTPDASDLRRILIEPARRAGYSFENTELVDDMVSAVEGRPGALALLSFAASKLWEHRNPEQRMLPSAAYEEMGGVTGALAQHGESVLEKFTAKQRGLVREVFRRLVTAEGTRATTRHDDLLSVLGGDEEARVVVERLVSARLLVIAEADDGTEHIEVIHEALLSAWPRIVEWQREDAAGSRFRDQIRAAAQQWEERRRPRGLLWRDELVEEYGRWILQHPTGLTAGEAAFGKASLAERGRGRRIRMAVIGLLALAAVVTSYVAWQQSLARKAAQRATVEATNATKEAKEANRHAEEAAFRARDAARLAAAHLHAEDPTTQLALVRDIESKDPLPDWAPEARKALHGGVASLVLAAHDGPARAIDFAPDGRRFVTGGDDKLVKIWSTDGTGEPLVLRGHTDRVSAVAFSPDGRLVASAGNDKTVRIWGANGEGETVVLRGHARSISTVSFSPDGQHVVSASTDQTARIWNVDGTGEPFVLRGPASVEAAAWSPDGRLVAMASGDKVLLAHSDGTGKPLVLGSHDDRVISIAFSHDGRHVISGSFDATVRVWDAAGSGKPVVLRGHGGEIGGVAFLPGDKQVASSSVDETIRIWNADGSGDPRILRGLQDLPTELSVNRAGDRLISSDMSGTVRMWRLDIPDDPVVLRGHTRAVESVSVSPDGKRIVSGGDDQLVLVRSADGTGDPVILRGHEGNVGGVAFSPDNLHVASASFDHTIRVWNADGTGKPLRLGGHNAEVLKVAYSPDGKRLAGGYVDRLVRVWNADGTGNPLLLRGHEDLILGVSYSPDGKRIASASRDKTVRIWNADGSGEPIVLVHPQAVYSPAFSPDGSKIATAAEDNLVRVWNADGTGEPLIFRGHTTSAVAVAFSPDGKRLASAASDRTIRIWNADGTGEPVVLVGHTGDMDCVAFSPDGRRVYSASDDKTVRIWSDLSPLLPGDPRLWEATNYCLPADSLERLLGVDAEVAESLHSRCLARVKANAVP